MWRETHGNFTIRQIHNLSLNCLLSRCSSNTNFFFLKMILMTFPFRLALSLTHKLTSLSATPENLFFSPPSWRRIKMKILLPLRSHSFSSQLHAFGFAFSPFSTLPPPSTSHPHSLSRSAAAAITPWNFSSNLSHQIEKQRIIYDF